MLVNIESLYKYFNGEPILKNINMTVEDRETVGLIGSNGCGKSTLLRIITGYESFDKTPEGYGSVSVSTKASIGFLQQNSGLDSDSTIDAEMHKAFDKLLTVKKKMEELEVQMASMQGDELEFVSQEYAQLSAYFEAHDGYIIDVKIKQILNGMGFGNTPSDRIISSLSGGEKPALLWQSCCLNSLTF